MKIKIKLLYSKELDSTLLVDYDNNYIVYRELQGGYAVFYMYANHKKELKRLCADANLTIQYVWESTSQHYNNHNFYITGGDL